MAPKHPVSQLDKVTVKDWMLAAVGFMFTLAGLLIIRRDFKVGITTLAFFGSCFALSVRVILRKLRLQKQGPMTATVVGGEPIRPSKARMATLGGGLFVVGTILSVFQPDNDKVMFGISIFVASVGALFLVALATGWLSKAFIQFDQEGLTLGFWRGKTTIPWSSITNVARGEIHSNPAIFIWVDHNAVTTEPPEYLTKIRKQMASARAWTGADFAIMSSNYGIDAPVLLAAIERYASEPASREQLRTTPRL